MEGEASNCPGLVWEGADLPQVAPGDYQAVCIGWQGPEWVRAFRRWSVRVEFSLLAEGTLVSAFFNLGSDPTAPRIGRRSRFYAVWCLANGDTPRKGQRMTFEILTDPTLLYLVRVADSLKDGKDGLKAESMVYSRVTEVLRIERP